jgi:hypothetical protein
MAKKTTKPRKAAVAAPSVSMLIERAGTTAQAAEAALKKLRVALRSPKQGADDRPVIAEKEDELIVRLKSLNRERKALLKKIGK